MCIAIGYNRNFHITNISKRSTFQVNKRDHKTYLRDIYNLETRLARKQCGNQPDSMFKDGNKRWLRLFGQLPKGIKCNLA
jgi:hypothetical protein